MENEMVSTVLKGISISIIVFSFIAALYLDANEYDWVFYINLFYKQIDIHGIALRIIMSYKGSH